MKEAPNVNPPKATARMKLFVSKALEAMDFWDFCCDHGYIGILALRSEKFKCIHFVDQQKHIIENLKLRFHKSENFLKEHYQYKFYDQDARTLSTVVTGNLLIAGVGGKLAFEILQSLEQKKQLKAQRILISVHSEEQKYTNQIALILSKYTQLESIPYQEGRRLRNLAIFDLLPN